jgi:hypothetical protein
LSVTNTYYDHVVNKIKADFENDQFWKQLIEIKIKQFNEEYLVKNNNYHLILEGTPRLYIKPFGSFLLKTFRKNVLDNDEWPDKPSGDWLLPDNWFSKINDIIRTTITVKYLDGVEFLSEKIHNYCVEYNKECECLLEAREEGYYAAHLYTKLNCEIPKITWDTKKIDVLFEIQITTQLQEVIKRLLHTYYEKRRETVKHKDAKWQWDYKSDEFVTNYLGHILHYVEGMIMEIREKQRSQ